MTAPATRADRPPIALRLVHLPQGPAPEPQSWPVGTEGLTIGRSPECALVLPDRLRVVSRLHARVDLREGVPFVHCLSAIGPVWLNGVALGQGDEAGLATGDHLRIGGFELVLDGPGPAADAPASVARPPAPAPASASAAAKRTGRGRLDDWFDLETASDPLGPGSPLPEVEQPAAFEPASMAAHAARAADKAVPPPTSGAGAVIDTAVADAGAVNLAAVDAGLANDVAALADRPRFTARPAPQAARDPVAGADTDTETDAGLGRPAAPADPDAAATAELLEAFLRGAGLASAAGLDGVALTPEWMHQLGQILRTATEGTLALLQSRATLKDGMGLENTRIAQIQNNPLKFVPDAQAALEHLIGRRSLRGYMAPVEAVRDAHDDLLIHHLAVMAGMRAAVFELFNRLAPEAVLEEHGPAAGWARLLPALHDAALWRRHLQRHQRFEHSLDDDFEAVFGRQFKRAYEAQSRGLLPTSPAEDDDDAAPGGSL